MPSETVQGLKYHLQLYKLSWYGVTGLTLCGVFMLGFTGYSPGWVLLIAGTSILLSVTLIISWQTTKRGVAQPEGGRLTIIVGATGFFLALILASELIPTTIEIAFVGRLVLLVTGTQALFLAISLRRSEMAFSRRIMVPAVGHLLLGVGSLLLVIAAFRIPDTRVFQGVILWYATGLSALALDTFWMGQQANEITPPPPNSTSGYWEKLLLGAILVGISCLIFIVFTSLDEPLTFEVASLGQPWTFETRLEQTAVTVVGACAVIAFATLAAPASAPKFVQRFDRTGLTIGSHALTAVVLINTVLLGLFFLAPITLVVVFGVLIGLVTLAVLVDYVRSGYIHRYSQRNPPSEPVPLPDSPSVTVVVLAYNEADILPETIERNLTALSELQFLVVPAANSTDGTVEVANEYQARYPDRIRVLEGTTGTKAGDLNRAWEAIDTSFVLLLDADEITDLVFVSRALSVLNESPDVGIVQARKVRRYADTWMARFISAERRVETWINHQFINNLCAASHFAGSAAVIRHEAPQDIEGWSTQALTEDIDFTVRLYVETDWRIEYRSQLAVYNLPPATLLDLIRQRRRWARGWVEVTWRYTRDLIRSRHSLGWRKTVGLLWELFATISAPLYLVSIAVTIFILAGIGPPLPLWVAIFLAVLLLPARGLIFAYAAWHDPIAPVQRKVTRIPAVILFAYLWICLTWLIQLHVLYLQLAGAAKRWEVTNKIGAHVESSS